MNQFLELIQQLKKVSASVKDLPFADIIQSEIDGKTHDPSLDLDALHNALRENNISDKQVKHVLRQLSNNDHIYNNTALLDYYLIFLGFDVKIGQGWLDSDEALMSWYKKRIHDTNYGKIALKHRYGSTYHFKLEVAQAVERWLFNKWKFVPQDNTQLRHQICCIKNARLVIDIALLKKIFEFNCKDILYNKEIIDFLNSYKFEIQKFETNLLQEIEEIGCEYRRRLDDCYELIFS